MRNLLFLFKFSFSLLVVIPVDCRRNYNSREHVNQLGTIIDNDAFNCSFQFYKDETMHQCCPCQSCDQYGHRARDYINKACMKDGNLDSKLFCRVASPTTDERCLYYNEVQRQRDLAHTTLPKVTTEASSTTDKTSVMPTTSTGEKTTVSNNSERTLVIVTVIIVALLLCFLILICFFRPTINKTKRNVKAWMRRKKMQKRETDEEVQMGLTTGSASEPQGLSTGNQQQAPCSRDDSKSIITQVTQRESEINCKGSNLGSFDGGPPEYLPGASIPPSIPPSNPPSYNPTSSYPPNPSISITGNLNGDNIHVGTQNNFYGTCQNCCNPSNGTSNVPSFPRPPFSSSNSPMPRSFSNGSSCSSCEMRSSYSRGQRDLNSRVEEVQRPPPQNRFFQSDHQDQKDAMMKHSQHQRKSAGYSEHSLERQYQSDTTRPYMIHQVSVHAESDDSSEADTPPIQVTLSDEEDIYSGTTSTDSSTFVPRRPPDDSFKKS